MRVSTYGIRVYSCLGPLSFLDIIMHDELSVKWAIQHSGLSYHNRENHSKHERETYVTESPI